MSFYNLTEMNVKEMKSYQHTVFWACFRNKEEFSVTLLEITPFDLILLLKRHRLLFSKPHHICDQLHTWMFRTYQTHTEQLHVETKKYHIEQTWNFLRVQQHSGAWNGFRLVLNAAPCLLCSLKHAGHRPSNRVKSVVQQGEHFMTPPLDILFYFA